MSDRWVFVRQGLAYERGTPLVTGSYGMEVPAGRREAEPAVRTASHAVSILVVLPVVLPEAHGADLEVAALIERQEATARTVVRTVLGLPVDVDERSDHGWHSALPCRRSRPNRSRDVTGQLNHQLGKLGSSGAGLAADLCERTTRAPSGRGSLRGDSLLSPARSGAVVVQDCGAQEVISWARSIHRGGSSPDGCDPRARSPHRRRQRPWRVAPCGEAWR